MSEDDLWLKELARVNRDETAEEARQLDERWDRLSAGELSQAEEAELRALAETSEEGREAYEAFRPLGGDFQAGVVKAIREQGLKEEGEAAAPRAKVLPFSRRARFAGWGAAVAAVAAAVILFVRPPAQPPLPGYALAPLQGDQDSRGESVPLVGLPRFSPGSNLTLVLEPLRGVEGPVEVQAFLADGGGLVPWRPARPFEVAESGAVRLNGTLGRDVQLPRGEQTVWIVVSRPGKGPSASELQIELRAGRTGSAGWRAVCEEVRAAPLRQGPWQVACVNLRVEDRPPS